jgi:putative ABC transport system substrate-binding protein
MRRRQFIKLVGAAAAWPIAARAQQAGVVRRVGVLMGGAESDPESQTRINAFRDGLQKLGWTAGRNLRIDIRWVANDPGHLRGFADELLAMTPDVILAGGTPPATVLHQATRTIPVVFAQVADPVALGLVTSLARPGGNSTGFGLAELAVDTKKLELLKQIAPRTTRVAFLYDPANPSWPNVFSALEASASSIGITVSAIPVGNASEIERALDLFAREPNGGLIALPSVAVNRNRDLINTLAARHSLPNVWFYRYYVAEGGLASYGPDDVDLYRRAASYVDRILRGEKPGDLPVQNPTRYELVINLKTAKALGLTVPDTLLALADEVIEQ